MPTSSTSTSSSVWRRTIRFAGDSSKSLTITRSRRQAIWKPSLDNSNNRHAARQPSSRCTGRRKHLVAGRVRPATLPHSRSRGSILGDPPSSPNAWTISRWRSRRFRPSRARSTFASSAVEAVDELRPTWNVEQSRPVLPRRFIGLAIEVCEYSTPPRYVHVYRHIFTIGTRGKNPTRVGLCFIRCLGAA